MLARSQAYSYRDREPKVCKEEKSKSKWCERVCSGVAPGLERGSRCGSNHVVTPAVWREAECATSTLNHPIFFGARQPIARSSYCPILLPLPPCRSLVPSLCETIRTSYAIGAYSRLLMHLPSCASAPQVPLLSVALLCIVLDRKLVVSTARLSAPTHEPDLLTCTAAQSHTVQNTRWPWGSPSAEAGRVEPRVFPP